MAELKFTEEEKALPFYHDLDDEALGKAAKAFIVSHFKVMEGQEDDKLYVAWFATIINLGLLCTGNNDDSITAEVKGLTYKGEPLGNWKLTLEKLNGSSD